MNAHEAWKAGWEKYQNTPHPTRLPPPTSKDAYREGFVAGYDKGMMTALKEMTPGLNRLADDIAAPADDFERTAL